MLLKFWYWFVDKPCEHDWETKEITVNVQYRDAWTNKILPDVTGRYTKVTKFCNKCGKLVQYKLS